MQVIKYSLSGIKRERPRRTKELQLALERINKEYPRRQRTNEIQRKIEKLRADELRTNEEVRKALLYNPVRRSWASNGTHLLPLSSTAKLVCGGSIQNVCEIRTESPSLNVIPRLEAASFSVSAQGTNRGYETSGQCPAPRYSGRISEYSSPQSSLHWHQEASSIRYAVPDSGITKAGSNGYSGSLGFTNTPQNSYSEHSSAPRSQWQLQPEEAFAEIRYPAFESDRPVANNWYSTTTLPVAGDFRSSLVSPSYNSVPEIVVSPPGDFSFEFPGFYESDESMHNFVNSFSGPQPISRSESDSYISTCGSTDYPGSLEVTNPQQNSCMAPTQLQLRPLRPEYAPCAPLKRQEDPMPWYGNVWPADNRLSGFWFPSSDQQYSQVDGLNRTGAGNGAQSLQDNCAPEIVSIPAEDYELPGLQAFDPNIQSLVDTLMSLDTF